MTKLTVAPVDTVPDYQCVFYAWVKWILINAAGEPQYAFRTKKEALAAASDSTNYPPLW